MNRRDRTTLSRTLLDAMNPIPLEDAIARQHEGVQILDVRDAATFAAAHLPRSINIGLNGQFATWCGSLLDSQRPIILIAESIQLREALVRLGRIGFDPIQGHLEYGPAMLAASQEPLQQIQRVTARALRDQCVAKTSPHIVDVRSSSEHDAVRIDGSQHIRLDELLDRYDELSRNENLVVYCRTGYQSHERFSMFLLKKFGLPNLYWP